MTTYTKIPDEERPTITVDALQPIARIEDNTYGGFTEFVPPPLQHKPLPRSSFHPVCFRPPAH